MEGSVKQFSAGETIQLELTIKNTSAATIMLIDTLPERDFDITVKDSKGVSVPLTGEGRRPKATPDTFRREFLFLEPGKELRWRHKVELNKLFDLKHTDNYTVSVERTYYPQNSSDSEQANEAKILSNTLTFKLTKGNAPKQKKFPI